MNAERLEYQPCKGYRCIIPAFISISGFSLIMTFVLQATGHRMIMIALSVLCTLISIFFYRESTVMYSFSKRGVELSVFKKSVYFYPWSAFSYSYIAKNYRGFRYLILSPKVLLPKEQKWYIYFGTLYTKARRDGVLSIYEEESLAEKLESCVAEGIQ